MYDFKPYLTNDCSIGLYNDAFNDIYHSATGALTEAYEKFIYPIDFEVLLSKDKINVLDICYGIGYNSKSFLNFLFEKIFEKNNFHAKQNISPVDTDNLIDQENSIYTYKIYANNYSSEKAKENNSNNIDTIYSNNIFGKISVTAIDNDKILAFLSPFIKTGIKNFSNKNLKFNYDCINKYLKNNSKNSNLKINKLINFLIFDKIIQKYPDFYTEPTLCELLDNKDYREIFDNDIKGIFKSNLSSCYNNISKHALLSFLHNIYYNHISIKYKKRLKRYKLQDVDFSLIIDDARNVIKNDSKLYNLIFLDAFSPTKCPCLWSLEFFQQLYNHLEQDGLILTYSTSASVRNAMSHAGLHIGNIINENKNKILGTVASKNIDLIKSPLSEFDLGLLKTRAGIFYRDENLTGLNEAIIERRKLEVMNSDLISSSKYNKLNRI